MWLGRWAPSVVTRSPAAGASVPRHFGVDDLGPEIDAPGEAPHLPKPQVPEGEASVHAPIADVAVDDRPVLAVQLLDARGQLRERNVDRALDVGLLPLPVLAHVQQDDLFPRIEHLVHDLGRDLEFLEVIPHLRITVSFCFSFPARKPSDSKYPIQMTAASA